jgi:anti-sigma B factor antagonist
MRLSERHVGNASVLDVVGPMSGHGVGAIPGAVRDRVRAGRTTVVVNLEGVPAVDLSGLGSLAEAQAIARGAGGVMRLAGVTKRIDDLVVITRLLTTFDVFDSVEEAAAGSAAAPSRIRPSAPLGEGRLAGVHQ